MQRCEVGDAKLPEQRQVQPVDVGVQDVKVRSGPSDSIKLRRVGRERVRPRATEPDRLRDNRYQSAGCNRVPTRKQGHLVA